MPEFAVSWHIDLSADTLLLAATEALEIHRDAASLATVFDIRDEHDTTYRIDLDDDVPVVLARSRIPRRGLSAWLSGRLTAWAAVLDDAPGVAA
ncbi:hypothetical protein OHB12_05155 [Nocardia sp. NBC_01730]|uniref:hypothetical protein n=1 Tax=Nocardia sp. NBC_01730 TaxID=2975998 RepID=UPI002E0F6785|nr:hypothetical protein OHB12_05155 [Nocardia sp. NBC_01730]